jgi:hypothetical protein
MNKNWLIRTKNNHILGPVSREKIKELIGNGTIKGDDEVCSGNGYWIYIREQELLSKYIMGGAEQGFNPVQEAQPSSKKPINVTPEPSTLPEQSDLEYPDMENFKEKNDNQVDSGELSLDDSTAPPALDMESPDTSSSADPVMDEGPPLSSENIENTSSSEDGEESNVVSIKKNSNPQAEAPLKAGKKRKGKKNNSSKTVKKPSSKISMNFLYIMAIIFLLIAAISYKFKKTILNEINKRVSISIFSEAIAQDSAVNLKSKKKNG